jgi:outer membrane receptor for Fe3+-dicitrate
VRFERDLSPANRLGIILRQGSSQFGVPNEHIQQEGGQREDRSSRENAAQFSLQRIFSSTIVGDVRGMVRGVSAKLWSNQQSTPIVASQDRGFREFYLNGSIAGHRGIHEWKGGGDLNLGRVREDFAYTITDENDFDSDVPLDFAFSARRPDREQALFVQDQIRSGPWTVNAGLRWDHYSLVVADNAFSPRLAVAWSSPAKDLVVRASYDRAFQTPAIENLLLASTDEFARLGAETARLPVPSSRGNFFEAGLSKAIGGRARFDVTGFNRRMTDVADDDLLLNTGVSFPIAFESANIYGAEAKVELRQGNKLSGFLGYSLLRGVGHLPVTGGLFLGDDIEELESTEEFPLTQDQRHTVRGRITYQFSPSTWLALTGSFGSGLPFEDFSGTAADASEQFGEHVVNRVNFETGRVRPNASVDVAGGITLAKSTKQALRLQAEVRNLTNRFDVINFAGLFSGTALAPPRTFAVRLRFDR